MQTVLVAIVIPNCFVGSLYNTVDTALVSNLVALFVRLSTDGRQSKASS